MISSQVTTVIVVSNLSGAKKSIDKLKISETIDGAGGQWVHRNTKSAQKKFEIQFLHFISCYVFNRIWDNKEEEAHNPKGEEGENAEEQENAEERENSEKQA